MKVLVTGGAGFIGSHVVDKLMVEGHDVVVLDNLSSGSTRNIERHTNESRFRFVEGDIRQALTVERAIEGVDAVVHEAAIVSVPLSIENPGLTNEVNVRGTLNLLEASARAGVKRFVYVSSCAVYGDAAKMPINEETPARPLSPYASSKLAAEGHCTDFFENHGLGTVRLRYFNVYGPRQAPSEYAGVMVKFLERIRGDQPPVIFGDGEQTRDFVYVGDVAEATLLAIKRDGAEGHVFNVGTGEVVTINRLCDVFLELAGKEHLKPTHMSARPGEIRHSQADITRATKVLGYRPKVSLKIGVKEFIDWADAHHSL
jgi:nucleoside-diphosphate-sugar epimerase